MKKDISIIIPTYNNAKYLKRCIDSILKNKLNLEIIIVDDASTDNTEQMVKPLLKENIKYYKNSINKGVSYSRNYGIKKAQGKYIGFVDADDFVSNDMYKKLYEAAIEKDLDVCGCNFCEFYLNNITQKSKYHYNNNILTKDKILELFLTDKISMSVCDKIFKKESIKNTFNTNLQVGEDLLFCLQFFLNSNKGIFLDFSGYYYFQNSNSAVHILHPKLLQITNAFYNISKEDEMYLNQKFMKKYFYFRNNMVLKAIHTCSLSLTQSNKKEVTKYLKELKEHLSKSFCFSKYLNFYYKIEVFIIKFLGVSIHLKVFPIYEKIKKIIRK